MSSQSCSVYTSARLLFFLVEFYSLVLSPACSLENALATFTLLSHCSEGRQVLFDRRSFSDTCSSAVVYGCLPEVILSSMLTGDNWYRKSFGYFFCDILKLKFAKRLLQLAKDLYIRFQSVIIRTTLFCWLPHLFVF